MPSTQVIETTRSREGRIAYAGGDLVLEFDVWYAASVNAAYTAVWGVLPVPFNSGFGNLNPKQITFSSLGAPDIFRFQVRYGANNNGAGLTPDRLSFRIGANTAHITTALETLNRLSLADMGVSGVNLCVDATSNTTVAPIPTTSLTDTYIPQPSDVGQSLNITGGTGFTPGTYTITGISTLTFFGVTYKAWTLSASPAAVATTGGAWNRGTNVTRGVNLTVDVALADNVTPTTSPRRIIFAIILWIVVLPVPGPPVT